MFRNVFIGCLTFLSKINIRLGLTQGINDRRLIFRSNIVGSFGGAIRISLPDVHIQFVVQSSEEIVNASLFLTI